MFVAIEGIDGAGKTVQAKALFHDLKRFGIKAALTKWNSSPNVAPCIQSVKDRGVATPYTFSLLHAADLADRQEHEIQPALEKGQAVIADRWVYTAFARDAARGLRPTWLRVLYNFALKPDAVFYFKVDPKVALRRLVQERGHIGYYESGRDMKLAKDKESSYLIFQQKVSDAYDRMAKEFGFTIIDATQSAQKIHQQMLSEVEAMLPSKVAV